MTTYTNQQTYKAIMFLKKITPLFFLFFIASCSDSTSSQYSTYGAEGCGKFINSLDASGKLAKEIKTNYFTNWLAGYITAYNKHNGGNIISTTDIDGVLASVVKYCRENPLKDTVDATEATLKQLKK